MYAPDNVELQSILQSSKPSKQSFTANDAVAAGLVAAVSVGLGVFAIAYGAALGVYQASQNATSAVFGSRSA